MRCVVEPCTAAQSRDRSSRRPSSTVSSALALRCSRTASSKMLRRLAKRTGILKVHAHRFRHTFATWAIEQDARELDVQHLLGHSSPDMVRRYASTYNSEQAARRHVAFSPAERLSSGVEKRRFHRNRTEVSPKILNLRG